MQNTRDWLTVRLRENALARSPEPWQREHLQKVTWFIVPIPTFAHANYEIFISILSYV